jgi:hypothetical protein
VCLLCIYCCVYMYFEAGPSFCWYIYI